MQFDLDSIKDLKYRQKPMMLKITIKLDKIKKILSSLFGSKPNK